jgi:hypothetical protein
MSGIPRTRRLPGRSAGRAGHGRPGRDGSAGRFIKDIAAAAGVAGGQHWPAPTATMPRRRTITLPRLRPRTVQLRIHCRQSPVEFWVTRNGGMPARRPWCLSCCQGLGPGRYHVISGEGHGGAGRVR